MQHTIIPYVVESISYNDPLLIPVGYFSQAAAEFQYVDVWSSEFSWNYDMPEEGDLVIIPSDMTILLDTKTPILKMLLIQGKATRYNQMHHILHEFKYRFVFSGHAFKERSVFSNHAFKNVLFLVFRR